MSRYRIARRSFLTAVGGAVGLRIMLDNMSAIAQGAQSPPRFLMTHWPVGTVHYWFKPEGEGSNYKTSRILQPFEDAGLRQDMIVLYGMNSNVGSGLGGGHEAGTVMSTTGARCPGTRANGGEPDDAAAGGASFDQIFLKNVPELQRPGVGYANAICDARVDSLETSTQCLSYGHTKRSIAAARGGRGGRIEENVPLLPELSPTQLYLQLFTGFMPGGSTAGNLGLATRALSLRKSVLDYSMGELDRIRTLAPAAERSKIDLHADSVRKIEQQLSSQMGDGGLLSGCGFPLAPTRDLVGAAGSQFDYGRAATRFADDEMHRRVGIAHAGVIKAAFECDLIRVATLQWSPGTNHVSFKGLYPDDPNAIFMHHPLSHDVGLRSNVMSSPPVTSRARSVVEFLANVNTWYNARTAEVVSEFKRSTDAFGGNLLDHTVIPYVTEVAETTHSWSSMPAMIFGGKALGMKGGQYLDVGEGGGKPYNSMWMSVAQAYLGADPLSHLAGESFVKTDVGPLDGVWGPTAS